MKKFLRQLFCRHWRYLEFSRYIYGDEINQRDGARTEWVCRKCDWRWFN